VCSMHACQAVPHVQWSRVASICPWAFVRIKLKNASAPILSPSLYILVSLIIRHDLHLMLSISLLGRYRSLLGVIYI
jgi:hypothetical protein